MRLNRRVEALAHRLPDNATGGEDAVNRIVFARHRRETEAALAATPAIDYDEYARRFEAALAEHGEDLLAEMERYFVEAMAQEAAEYGPWMMVTGHGRIREKDYMRLRAQVTGGRDAAHHAP